MTPTDHACDVAAALMADGDHHGAARMLWSALTENPTDEYAMRLYTLALSGQGALPQALWMGWQTVRRHPRSALAQCTYADVLHDSGRPREALTAVDEALRLEPRFADAWVLRGDLLLALSGAAAAEPNYAAALNLEPRHAVAIHNLAVSRLRWGSWTKAVRGLQLAVTLSPGLAQSVTENIGLGLARVLRLATPSVVFVAVALAVVTVANAEGMPTVVPRIAAATAAAALAVPLVWIHRLRLGPLLCGVLRQHPLLGARIGFVAIAVVLGMVTAVVGPNLLGGVAGVLLPPGIVVLTLLSWVVKA